MLYPLVIALSLSPSLVFGQSPVWGQCGGLDWSGPTSCAAGSTCVYSNPYYSQCIPGASTSTTTNGGSSGTPTSTATGGTETLAPGFSFIRAVVDPNFHKYLQSQTRNKASPAVLGDPTTAAQFQISSGQLVQNAAGTNLYATVESRANSTVVKLGIAWSATPAATGTFSWSGDTLLWSSPTITRPQSNAFLVCPDTAGNRLLFVNLGPYGYQTPAGCNDHTIHAYTGSTATP